jgi:hypothetical protein
MPSPGPYPCIGLTYLSTGRADVDEPFQMVAECDGGPIGDCGWREVVVEDYGPDGTWDVSITSDKFLPLHERHLAHRASKKGSQPSS